MSLENVEIVRSIYRAVGRGDYSSSEWADPDIEFVAPYEERPLRGAEAMQRSWREFLSAWKDFKAEPEEIIDAGEQVLVFERVGGRGRGSGAPTEGLRSASLSRSARAGWCDDEPVRQSKAPPAHLFEEREDRVVVVTIQDARSSSAAISG
jgi:hypothetical protein